MTKASHEAKAVTLDTAQALRDVGGDRELLCELAVFFQEDSSAVCHQLIAAIDAHRSEESRRLIHRLKGMAAQFHAEPATSLSVRTEDLVKISAWEELSHELLFDLRAAFEATVKMLRDEHLLQ